jgi:hypothetical protein
MRSVMERSVRLVNSYLHKDAVSLRGSRKFQVWDFLSVSYEWFSLCKELQYKHMVMGSSRRLRVWYLFIY